MTDVWQELAGLVLVGLFLVAMYWLMKVVALWRNRDRRVTWTQGDYDRQARTDRHRKGW
jgi:hypothetical protein